MPIQKNSFLILLLERLQQLRFQKRFDNSGNAQSLRTDTLTLIDTLTVYYGRLVYIDVSLKYSGPKKVIDSKGDSF